MRIKEDVDRELVALLNKYDGFVACMLEENYDKRMESITSKTVASGLFSKPEVIHAHWVNHYTANEYFGYMLTGHLADKSDGKL